MHFMSFNSIQFFAIHVDGRVTYFVGHLLEPKPDMKLIPSKAAADLFNRTAVYAAAEGSNKNVLEMVLEAECHVQDVDRKHRSVLHAASPGGFLGPMERPVKVISWNCIDQVPFRQLRWASLSTGLS